MGLLPSKFRGLAGFSLFGTRFQSMKLHDTVRCLQTKSL